ncbi:MAG: hypothetical protein PVI72_01565, partial [Desulfobacterales bacterium]
MSQKPRRTDGGCHFLYHPGFPAKLKSFPHAIGPQNQHRKTIMRLATLKMEGSEKSAVATRHGLIPVAA